LLRRILRHPHFEFTTDFCRIGSAMPRPARESLSQRVSQFFFSEESPYGLALVRICLSFSLLVAWVPRWPYMRELFSTDGAPTPLWNNYGYPGLLPIPSPAVAIALYTLLGCALLSLMVGWMSRTSALIACVLTAYFGMLDTISTLTKFTCIATHVLLLLSLSGCGSLWSLDARLRGRAARWPLGAVVEQPRFPVWPRRLMQFLMGIIYFAAATTKMQTPLYFSGDQMQFWLLSNVNFANPVGEFLSLYPPALVGMALGTIIWEIVFLFACWGGRGRTIFLSIGVVFHVMTALTLGLIVFPLVCLSTYWAFFSEADYRRWGHRLNRLAHRVRSRARATRLSLGAISPRPMICTPRTSQLAFAAVCGLAIVASLEAEHWLDPYGVRRPEGLHELTRISDAEARMMLAGTEPIRVQDKLLDFQVGTMSLGGMLANHRDEFVYGERAILECAILPPHEDVWVEVNLHDARDRLIERNGQILQRSAIRSHFQYQLDERLVPGEYDFVLRLNGSEVGRQTITLSATGAAPTVSASAATALAR
jgi:hypothetical protein